MFFCFVFLCDFHTFMVNKLMKESIVFYISFLGGGFILVHFAIASSCTVIIIIIISNQYFICAN